MSGTNDKNYESHVGEKGLALIGVGWATVGVQVGKLKLTLAAE